MEKDDKKTQRRQKEKRTVMSTRNFLTGCLKNILILVDQIQKKSRNIYYSRKNIILLAFFVIDSNLKGVFAKNERGYRLNAIKKRF